MQLILMVVYVCCSVSGLVLFKLGSASGLLLEVTKADFMFRVSWLSVLGLMLYVISFLLYMGLIAKNNLSYIVPVTTAAVYLLTLVCSVLVFKEQITWTQIVGSVVILVGVLLINLKKS